LNATKEIKENKPTMLKEPVDEGRPSKETLIVEYIKNHPNESVTEAARALGVSRPTVYKYKSLVVVE